MMKSKYIIAAGLVSLLCSVSVNAASPVTGLNKYSQKLKTWSKSDSFGNSWINSSYNLKGDISYEKLGRVPYAAYAGSHNTAKVTVMKRGFNVATLNGEVAANAYSSSHLAKLNTKAEVLGKKLWSINKTVGKSEQARTLTIWSTKDSSGKEKYRVFKKFTKSFTLPLGPIPFQVEAGGQGEIGIAGKLQKLAGLAPQISFDFGPYASIAGIVAAKVNVVVARGGVGASLTLLKVKQTLNSKVKLDKLARFADFNFSLPGSISSLSGKVSFIGEVRSIKMCKKWKIKYPCGFTWAEVVKKSFLNWSGFTKKWNLYTYKKHFSNT